MKFRDLTEGRLVRRYKRFLADVLLETGEEVTAHVANSGSMMGLTTPGMRVFLSKSDDPKRKLAWSWELAEVDEALFGINTALPNGIVAEAIAAGAMEGLAGYASLRREVKYGVNSRIDILLEDPVKGRAFVEVKNVTLLRQPGLAEFPDAVTARGAKHLDELVGEVAAGHRAVMVYLVQISSADRFTLAEDIDPAYARAFRRARAAGVEAIALGCRMTVAGVTVGPALPLHIDG